MDVGAQFIAPCGEDRPPGGRNELRPYILFSITHYFVNLHYRAHRRFIGPQGCSANKISWTAVGADSSRPSPIHRPSGVFRYSKLIG